MAKRVRIVLYISGTDENGRKNGETYEYDGRAVMNSDGFFVSYSEEASAGGGGEKEINNVLLKIYGDHMVIKKSGAVLTELKFRAGERYCVSYGTKYGTVGFYLRTDAYSCEIILGSVNVRVNAGYVLDYGGYFENRSLMLEILPE